jgi:adenylate cyclase
VHCPACNVENDEGSLFCESCGSALERICAYCAGKSKAGARFCRRCGQAFDDAVPAGQTRSPRDYTPKHLTDKILQSKSALEGERKQVTVLFADVQGSMELAAQVDPEVWHTILDGFFQILTDGVHRFEGTVNQYTGDGIMALFGAPIAHEDHAQRACYTALALRDELTRYATEVKREHGLGFLTRMGMHSGEVVVGSIGDDLRMDYTAQGHTVGLAQRMEALASPDSCYLTASTAALVDEYFTLEDLGQFRVKGVGEPVRVHRLVGSGTSRTRFDIARARGLARFVGRAADLRTLEEATEQAAAGKAPVVGVVAEAGTGKSRLCFEFLQRCRAHGMRVFEGRAVAHGRNVPFLPILELLRAYLGIAEDDDDRSAREKIAGRMVLLDRALADTLPLLFDFLGVADPEQPAPRLDPEARQRQLLAVMHQVVHGISETQPTVTLIEDLHWLDAASDEFLARMVDARPDARNLLLVNFRPEYRAEWMQQSAYRQIPLTPLGRDAITELLADLLGNDPSIAALAEPIHARTSGNPFFIEEVVQSLIESGKLEGRDGGYRLTASIDTLDVPVSVQAVLAARIDRLAEGEKQLLQAAAVIGKEFSEPVLTRVLGDVTPQDDAPAEVAAGLRALAHAEFVHEQALYPVAEYTFKHPLTQEVAYGTLLRQRRERVHAAVAAASVEIYAEKLDEKAALVAHHWEQAGESRQAALWYERAAQWAGVTNAAEGMRHWDRVRRLLRPLPQSDEVVQLRITACVWSLNLAWRLGTPVPVATDVFEEGRRLAEEAGDIRAQAALHGSYGCALGLLGGDSDEYVRYSLEGARLADQTEDQALRIAQRAFVGFGSTFAGRLASGLESCETAYRTFPADPALGIEFTGYSPLLGIMMTRAWLLARLGRPGEATAACDEAEELARAHGDVEVLTWMQLPRIELATLCDDAGAAQRHARSALETGAKSATPQSLFVGSFTLGVAHRLSGAWDDALAMLEEARRYATSGNNSMFEGWVRSELVKVLLERDELDTAEQEAIAAVTFAQMHHCRYDEARAHLAVTRTQLRRTGAEALRSAAQALDRAQEIIDEIQARFHQPEVHECRAHMARLHGDPRAAQSEIDRARELYAEMGMTAQVERLGRDVRA